MKANELRIENLVNRYYEKKYDFGSAVEWQPIVFQLDDFKLLECYDHKPIPLTEEWLLKFGFEKRESGHFIKDGIVLYPIRDLYFRGNLFIKADIKNVHQLQNLYFALTGKELTISE
jgi:hypothetical protein